MKPIITVQGVSKQYRIGRRRTSTTLRESLTDAVSGPWRRLASRWGRSASPRPADSETILWALQDISFEVRPGEIVGIIGRNGAGKSTLLKLLSRITEPTTGRMEFFGRTGSLLEVGTGFHPELTGRENIFLNGAILGIRRREIVAQFDQIVAFAGVERFLDTPVKHYSSGMYMRLAFAVAAHLDPEILLVDEVLAVGDASFQRRCLDKMRDVGSRGRTVLFVSHNMMAITRLCERTILLERGRILADGPSPKVVSSYLSSDLGTTGAREWSPENAPGNHIVRLLAVRVRTKEGQVADALDIRQPIGLEMEFEVLQPDHLLVPNFHVSNEEGICVFILGDMDPAWKRRPRPAGRFVSTAWIPGNFLAEGTLVVGAAVSTMDPVMIHFWEREAVAFQVMDSLDGDSARGDYAGPYGGVVRPIFPWTTNYAPLAETPSPGNP